MSSIPPDIISSGVQAGWAQRDAAKTLEADRAGQSHAARTIARASDEAATNVETGDSDTEVFTDAEGSGSQGRPFEDRVPEEEGDISVAKPDGETRRLDIEV